MSGWQDLSICVRDDLITLETAGRRYSGAALDEPTLTGLEVLREQASPKAYGARLFEALFVGELREWYVTALATKDTQWRIHLDLETSAPRVNGLWWEALTAQGPPPLSLGRSYRTPFSRRPHVDGLGGEKKAVGDEKLKVLVVISNPTDLEGPEWRLPRLDEAVIAGYVEAAMRPLEDRIDYRIQTRPASLGSIRELLSGEGYHVLHVFGSGAFREDEGCLLLENEQEEADGVGTDDFAELVMGLPDLRLVVLSSPHGGASAPRPGLVQPRPEVFVSLAPTVIAYGVPAVVVMQDCVHVEVAGLFTEKFYAALGRSKTGMVDEVVNLARENIFFHRRDTWDWTIPVLFMSGAGVLFKPAAGEVAVESPSAIGHRPALSIAPDPKRAPPVNPFEWVGGKRPPPGTAAHEKSALWQGLSELHLTNAELMAFCGPLGVSPHEIHAETLEERIRLLVEIVVERGTASDLDSRIAAFRKTRDKAMREEGTVYDLGDRRVARGSFS